MPGQRFHYSLPAQTLTGTYQPPKGKHLYRATPKEFVSFLIAYINLWLARREANDRHLSPQENRVSLSHFRRIRVLDQILLWMWYQGHVDYCQAESPGDRARFAITPHAISLFTPFSSFWLTDRGDAFAEIFLCDALLSDQEAFETAWSKLVLGQLLPSYELEDRVFHWGSHLLKWFRQPAENQELVLRAEEELDWPSWMDDPLPRINGSNPKIRIHDTIKDLNRNHHETGLLHFHGDGTGTRIGWRYSECVANALSRLQQSRRQTASPELSQDGS